MTSIANAIIIYGWLKYVKEGSYPLGLMVFFTACVDIIIAAIISAGI